MKHARKDYDRIQDPANLIPEDEPVFLIRGQDPCAPAALEAWCVVAEKNDVDAKMIQAVKEQAKAMQEWGDKKRRKIPDMP